MNEMDVITIALAIIAIIVSGLTFYLSYKRGRKSAQLQLLMEISNKLDDAENKIFDFRDRLNSNITDQQIINGFIRNLRDSHLLYLNHWEYFSFLINIREISDERIIDYYKSNFVSGVKGSFNEYPDVRDNKERYEEIKKLLKEWDSKYYSLHFESK